MQKEILPFVMQYNPFVPNLKHILMEKWHLIESQPKLKETFKEPPIISYKRGISLRAGCKESHFYSLPFGQAEANIY